MKKATLFLGAIILLASSSFAQVTIKPHVGMNFSLFTADPVDYNDPGIHVGFLFGAGVKIGEDFYVEPGIQYFGTSYDLVHKTDSDQDINAIFRGMRIPVVAGYQFGDNDDLISFRIFAGPSATIIFNVETDNPDPDLPQSEDFNSLIWGANVGVGLDVWFLYLETGYDFGLSNVYKGESTFDVGKSNMFWISLGVNIGG